MDGNDRALTAFTVLGHATCHTYELVVPLLAVSGLLGFFVFLEAPVDQEVISKHVPADLRRLSFGWTDVAVFGVGALGSAVAGTVLTRWSPRCCSGSSRCSRSWRRSSAH